MQQNGRSLAGGTQQGPQGIVVGSQARKAVETHWAKAVYWGALRRWKRKPKVVVLWRQRKHASQRAVCLYHGGGTRTRKAEGGVSVPCGGSGLRKAVVAQGSGCARQWLRKAEGVSCTWTQQEPASKTCSPSPSNTNLIDPAPLGADIALAAVCVWLNGKRVSVSACVCACAHTATTAWTGGWGRGAGCLSVCLYLCDSCSRPCSPRPPAARAAARACSHFIQPCSTKFI